MLKLLNLFLFLLFIDFASCILNEGSIIHAEAKRGEKISHSFEVGISESLWNKFGAIQLRLWKAQGEQDIFISSSTSSSPESKKTQIASNPYSLDDPYKGEIGERVKFSVVAPTASKPKAILTLEIDPATIEDSGVYTIQVYDATNDNGLNEEDTFTIFVHSEPEGVVLYGGNSGTNFTSEMKDPNVIKFESFNETTGELVCEGVAYGYRKPNIAWNLDFEIEGEPNFIKENKPVTTFKVELEGSYTAIKKPKTTVTTKVKGIKIKPKYNDKRVTCSMIDWKYKELKASKSTKLSIRTKPDIYGPNDPIGGVLGKPGVVFAEVQSSPVVDKQFWTRDNKVLSETDDLKLQQDCTIEKEVQKCNYTIKINKVLTTHYGTYKVTAKNKYGSDSLDVKFLDEKDKPFQTGSKCSLIGIHPLIPSFIMLIYVAIFNML